MTRPAENAKNPAEARSDEAFCDKPYGGEGGIRTHGGLAPTPVFETGAIDHSATSPCLGS